MSVRPLKQYGQNFLIDTFVQASIIKSAGKLNDRDVIEVGPGMGALSQLILKESPKRLISLEIDDRCIDYLKKNLKNPNFFVVKADAATLKWENFLKEHSLDKPVAMANLPYHVGSKILTDWLMCSHLFSHFVLMFQKEVGMRICAKEGEGDYGRLSIVSQFTCETTYLFDVDPDAFHPAPKVTSGVVLLKPKALTQRERDLLPILEGLTQCVFSQRRKMIKKPLSSYLSQHILDKVLTQFDCTQRPEQWPVENFIEISKMIQEAV